MLLNVVLERRQKQRSMESEMDGLHEHGRREARARRGRGGRRSLACTIRYAAHVKVRYIEEVVACSDEALVANLIAYYRTGLHHPSFHIQSSRYLRAAPLAGLADRLTHPLSRLPPKVSELMNG